MKKVLSYILYCLAFIGVLSTIAISPLMAADAKTYPGTMCIPQSLTNGIPIHKNSTIGNDSSTEWLHLDCPVINDIMAGTLTSSWVAVLDRHYSLNIGCSSRSVYWSTATDSYYSWIKGGYFSNGIGFQKISFGVVNGAGQDVHSFFFCDIPPKYLDNVSYVFNYHTVED